MINKEYYDCIAGVAAKKYRDIETRRMKPNDIQFKFGEDERIFYNCVYSACKELMVSVYEKGFSHGLRYMHNDICLDLCIALNEDGVDEDTISHIMNVVKYDMYKDDVVDKEMRNMMFNLDK